jgi:hypothetical protein
MAEKIKRTDALREMETREGSNGKTRYFSIQFYKKNGELVSFGRAKITGLRADMKKERLRGIQAVDKAGNPISHIHPFSIDNIRTFNEKQVVI